jgi:hypothetical protein
VIGYNAVGNGSNTATIGNSSITANYFTGSVNAGSFVKSGGTSAQILAADGSVITAGTNITISGGTISSAGGGITGSGVANQLTYWNGTGSVTGSATLTYTPTTSLLVNNSVTAASAIARGTNLTPTLTASANSDVLVGLDINPTFTNGAFTNVQNIGLRVGARFGVDRYLTFISPSNTTGIGSIDAGENNTLRINAGGAITLQYNGTSVVNTASATSFRPSGDNTIDLGGGVSSFRWKNVFGVNIYADSYIYRSYNIINNTSFNLKFGGIDAGFTSLSLYVNGGEKARLTEAGRLLLGTTDESTFILDVNGTARVSGAINSQISSAGSAVNVYRVGSTSIVAMSINLTAANNIEFDSANADYTFKRSAVEYFTIGNAEINSFFPINTKIVVPTGTNINYGLNIQTAAGSNRMLFGIDSGQNAVFGIGNCDLRIRQIASGNDYLNINFSTGNVVIEKNVSALTTIASAKLAVNSTTSGFLPPRMTTTQRDAIASPATGLVVYNTTLNSTDTYDGARWRTDSETIVTNRQTASYSLVLADRGKLVEMNSASANTLTIPLNSSIAFPIGTKIDVTQYGAGATTITATGGVTIRSFTSFLKIAGQYAACTLVKIGTDEWYCYGNLIA